MFNSVSLPWLEAFKCLNQQLSGNRMWLTHTHTDTAFYSLGINFISYQTFLHDIRPVFGLFFKRSNKQTRPHQDETKTLLPFLHHTHESFKQTRTNKMNGQRLWLLEFMENTIIFLLFFNPSLILTFIYTESVFYVECTSRRGYVFRFYKILFIIE